MASMRHWCAVGVVGLALSTTALAGTVVAARAVAATAESDEVFAMVGDQAITRAEFEQALERTIRGRFYHRAPPQDQLTTVRAEVGAALIERKLLLAEATRRGLNADEVVVARTLASYEQRYAATPRWASEGEAIKLRLAQHLREEQLLAALEARVRAVPPPDAAEVEAFYTANADRFTEPAQWDVSLILLRVDPSSPAATWNAAMDEAAELVSRVDGGADFAELARLHSADPTAATGGAMGYVHEGMLGTAAQAALEALSLGEVSEPLRVLEGVVLLRLNAVRAPRLVSLAESGERATALCARDKSDRAWTALKASLRAATQVTIHDSQWAAGDA